MIDYKVKNKNFKSIQPSIYVTTYKTKLKINTNSKEEGKIITFQLLEKLINGLDLPIKINFKGVKFGLVKRFIDYSKQNNQEIRSFVEYNKLEKYYEVLFMNEKDILKEEEFIDEPKVKTKSL